METLHISLIYSKVEKYVDSCLVKHSCPAAGEDCILASLACLINSKLYYIRFCGDSFNLKDTSKQHLRLST